MDCIKEKQIEHKIKIKIAKGNTHALIDVELLMSALLIKKRWLMLMLCLFVMLKISYCKCLKTFSLIIKVDR